MYHPDKDYLKIKTATKEFAWLPKRCISTKKILWLSWVYRLEYIFYQDFALNTSVAHHEINDIGYHTPYWCSSKSYMLAVLKGEF